jgi:anti-sigma factor RsiW
MNDETIINRSRNISCREAETLISPYLEGTISDRDTAAFLKHIENCNRCYNELETDFMVKTTVDYLNDEVPVRSYNLRPLLAEHLKKSRMEMVHQHRMLVFRIVVSAGTGILFVLLLLDLTGILPVSAGIRAFFGL